MRAGGNRRGGLPRFDSLDFALLDLGEAPHRDAPPAVSGREEVPVGHRLAEDGVGDVVRRQAKGPDAKEGLSGFERRQRGIGDAALVEIVALDEEVGHRPPDPLTSGRVAVVEHQRVAVRIREERHVADAGVEDLAVEDDALRLQLLARSLTSSTCRAGCAFFCGANSMPSFSGSQIPKQVCPAQNSKRALSSGRNPSVST